MLGVGVFGFAVPGEDAEKAKDFVDDIEQCRRVVATMPEKQDHDGLDDEPAEPLLPPLVGKHEHAYNGKGRREAVEERILALAQKGEQKPEEEREAEYSKKKPRNIATRA